jgi:cation diffusion facilitator CzcD-associated flavoprotein CzcO
MLSWLIIGGGVHGTYLSHHLTQVAGVPRERLRVLDPHEEPLWRWSLWTHNTGMDFLRSSVMQHLDIDMGALERFAHTADGLRVARFAPPERRPGLALFQAHAADVVARYQLRELRVRGTATGLSRLPGGWRVETSNGPLDARRVVLAMGSGESPRWPAWAKVLGARDCPVEHVFEPGFRRESLGPGTVAVLGGGATAGQLALALAGHRPGQVVMLSRHPRRVHPLDADPEWLSPEGMHGFVSADLDGRRALLRAARHRGSVPRDVEHRLTEATAAGVLHVRQGEVVHASSDASGHLRLDLGAGAEPLVVDRVVLATGFEPVLPGGEWLERAAAVLGLPRTPEGMPIIGPRLEWAPGLHVSGALADLQVGPFARSIAGGRRAAALLSTVAAA